MWNKGVPLENKVIARLLFKGKWTCLSDVSGMHRAGVRTDCNKCQLTNVRICGYVVSKDKKACTQEQIIAEHLEGVLGVLNHTYQSSFEYWYGYPNIWLGQWIFNDTVLYSISPLGYELLLNSMLSFCAIACIWNNLHATSQQSKEYVFGKLGKFFCFWITWHWKCWNDTRCHFGNWYSETPYMNLTIPSVFYKDSLPVLAFSALCVWAFFIVSLTCSASSTLIGPSTPPTK